MIGPSFSCLRCPEEPNSYRKSQEVDEIIGCQTKSITYRSIRNTRNSTCFGSFDCISGKEDVDLDVFTAAGGILI